MQAAPAGDYQIMLTWDTVADAKTYLLYRDGALYQELGGSGAAAFTDSFLSPGITYAYKVAAVCGTGGTELTVGSATARAVGPPIGPLMRSTFTHYLADGDSYAFGLARSPGRNEAQVPTYPQLVNHFLGLPARETNVAVPGSKCLEDGDGAYPSLQRRVSTHLGTGPWLSADLVTIGIGGNDLHHDTAGRYTSPDSYTTAEYGACLQSIIQMISPTPQDQLRRTLVLLTMVPFNNTLPGAPDGQDARRRAMNQVMRDAAFHSRIPVVDLANSFDQAIAADKARGECVSDSQCANLYLFDGVHANPRGMLLAAQAIVDKLLPNLGGTFSGPIGVPGTPRELIVPTAGTAKFHWQSPPASTPLRSTQTYEVAWGPAPFTSMTTALVGASSFSLPSLPTPGSSPLGIKVRAFDAAGNAGPWSLMGTQTLVSGSAHLDSYGEARRTRISGVWSPAGPVPGSCPHGCAFFFGGGSYRGDSPSANIYSYDGAARSIWKDPSVLDLPYGLLPYGLQAASAVWDPRITTQCPQGCAYLFGGRRSSGYSGGIIRFDRASRSSQVLDVSLPMDSSGYAARGYTASVWDDVRQVAYIFGGLGLDSSSSNYFYDQIIRFDPAASVDSEKIVVIGSLKRDGVGRCCSSAVWDGNSAYLFGGWTGSDTSSEILRFDPSSCVDPPNCSVSAAGTLPVSNTLSAAVWSGDAAYIFGGSSPYSERVLDDVFVYNPTTQQVSQLGARLPSARESMAAVFDGERVILAGGDVQETSRHAIGPPGYYVPALFTDPAADTLEQVLDFRLKPSAPMILDPAEGKHLPSTSVVVTGRAQPMSSITLSDAGVTLGSATAGETGSWTLTVSLTEGSHSLTATEVDSYGRTIGSTPRSVVVDTVAPASPLITNPSEGQVVNTSATTFSGTSEGGATVAVKVNGSTVGTVVASSSGTWTLSFPLTDGAYAATAVAKDAAGNESPPSTAISFSVQLDLPNGEVGSLPSGRWAAAAVFANTLSTSDCPAGCAFVFGGASSTTAGLNQIVRYRPDGNATGVGTLPKRVYGGSAVWDSNANVAYVFGGRDGENGAFSNSIIRYSPTTGAATVMTATLPIDPDSGAEAAGARNLTAAVWDARESVACPGGCAYIFGGLYYSTGLSPGSKYSRQIIRYNPQTDTTTIMVSQLPVVSNQGICCLTAAWNGSVAYLFWGKVTGTQTTSSVLRFDPSQDALTVIATSVSNHRRLSSAVWTESSSCPSGCALVFGGETNGAYTDQVLKFTEANGLQSVWNIPTVGTSAGSRAGSAAVWTGTAAYLFGGDIGSLAQNSPRAVTAQIIKFKL